jgi:hypothetical protein
MVRGGGTGLVLKGLLTAETKDQAQCSEDNTGSVSIF